VFYVPFAVVLLFFQHYDNTFRQLTAIKPSFIIREHNDVVTSLAFSADGTLLATAGLDSKVTVSAIKSGNQTFAFSRVGLMIETILFTKANGLVIAGWTNHHGTPPHKGFVILLDPLNGKPRTLLPDVKAVHSVALTTKGDYLAVATGDKVLLIDMHSLETVQTLNVPALTLVFNSSGNTLALVNQDQHMITTKLIKPFSSPKPKLRLLCSEPGFSAFIAFDPSRPILCASIRGDVIGWDTLTGDKTLFFSGHAKSFFTMSPIAYNPNGEILAVGTGPDTRLLDVATKRQIGFLHGHRNDVTALRISPTGDVLASGSKDKTVRVWSLPGLAVHKKAQDEPYP
jgi:WD40 repeat protein